MYLNMIRRESLVMCLLHIYKVFKILITSDLWKKGAVADKFKYSTNWCEQYDTLRCCEIHLGDL